MSAHLIPLRLAVGLGRPELERELLPALCDGVEFQLVDRCLTADELLERLQPGSADVALVAADLYRLGDEALTHLARRLPLVLLAPPAGPPPSGGGIVLPSSASTAEVRDALLAVAGKLPADVRPVPVETAATPDGPDGRSPTSAADGTILAVWGAAQERWRTTVAIGLAAALGAVAPTVLVDADLAAPSVAAHLDAAPGQGLATLCHADPQTPSEWEAALEAELQPLHPRSRHGLVLGGVPKPELRTHVSASQMERLLAVLAERYRYVVADVGTEVLGEGGAVHRAALRAASQVLLVTAADLVSLHRARTAGRLWREQLQLEETPLALVLADHDPRHQYPRREVEDALGLPVAAVLPHDQPGLQRALREQRPLVLDRQSRAGRALLELTERLHGGALSLPAASAGPAPRRRWPASIALLPRPHLRGLIRRKGAVDGRIAPHA